MLLLLLLLCLDTFFFFFASFLGIFFFPQGKNIISRGKWVMEGNAGFGFFFFPSDFSSFVRLSEKLGWPMT